MSGTKVEGDVRTIPVWALKDAIKFLETLKPPQREGLYPIGLVNLLNSILAGPVPASDPIVRLVELKAMQRAINAEIDQHIDSWVKSIQNGGAA